MTKTTVSTLPDSYFTLVKQFPLTRIRDKKHLRNALSFVDTLLREELDEGKEAYLDAISDLIAIFEDENESASDASLEDVLRMLMESNNLSQHKLSQKVGIAQSTLSAILTGGRKPTMDHILKLAAYFNLSPMVFLPRSASSG